MAFTRIASSLGLRRAVSGSVRSSAPPGTLADAAGAAREAEGGDADELGGRRRKLASFHANFVHVGGLAERRSEQLEEEIVACERLLDELEQVILSSPASPSSASSCQLSGGRSGCRGEEAAPGGAGRPLPALWGEAATRLEDLSADALETGCSREVPGAMEIFERASRAIDRMAALSKQHGLALGLQAPQPQSPGASPSRVSAAAAAARTGSGGAAGPPWAPTSGSSRIDAIPSQRRCMALEHCVSEAIRVAATLFAVLVCGCYEGLVEAARQCGPMTPQRPAAPAATSPDRAAAGDAGRGGGSDGRAAPPDGVAGSMKIQL